MRARARPADSTAAARLAVAAWAFAAAGGLAALAVLLLADHQLALCTDRVAVSAGMAGMVMPGHDATAQACPIVVSLALGAALAALLVAGWALLAGARIAIAAGHGWLASAVLVAPGDGGRRFARCAVRIARAPDPTPRARSAGRAPPRIA